MASSVNFFSLFSCIAVMVAVTSALDPNVPPVAAPVSAPKAAGVDCMSLIYDMVDCLSYLYVGSKETKPDSQCCFGLKTVLKTDGECVCEALKSSSKLGFSIDMNRALALPSACNTKAPSLESCHISNAPATSPVAAPVSNAPATSPVAAPANTPSTTPAPAPRTVLVSAKSPAPIAHEISLSPKSSAQVSPTSSITVHHAPAPAPKASAYSLVISPAVHLIVFVATFFYLLA